ncbi:cation:proton antiporter [Mycolicibacterium sp. 3033]|nr:cation:proton antiporter [Mycolicibacterium aurantiacum]
MALVLAFGLVLLISVSLSGLAARTVLSTALLFLAAGALLGPGGFGVDNIRADDEIVSVLADLALFVVLFTDGQRASLPALRENWRLSGRALGLGMPLTMVGIAVPAHFLLGLDWTTAFLIGAILSPTDPVFASALVGRDDVPLRLRRLLNVESGLNDGLALPFVLIFLATAQHEETELWNVATELVSGLVLGAAIAAAVALLWRLPVFSAEPRLQPLGPAAIAIVVYATCHLTHANVYLAAFAAGSTLATMHRAAAERFESFGDLLSELAKFAALIVFGALITPDLLFGLSWVDWLVPVIAILLVRPAALLLSLIRTRLPARERWTAAWFGPKGFASVVYGLLVLESGIPDAERVFAIVAATITLSIVLHSTTDVPAAKMLHVEPPTDLPGGAPEPESAEADAPRDEVIPGESR